MFAKLSDGLKVTRRESSMASCPDPAPCAARALPSGWRVPQHLNEMHACAWVNGGMCLKLRSDAD